jgi:hypothetical protein
MNDFKNVPLLRLSSKISERNTLLFSLESLVIIVCPSAVLFETPPKRLQQNTHPFENSKFVRASYSTTTTVQLQLQLQLQLRAQVACLVMTSETAGFKGVACLAIGCKSTRLGNLRSKIGVTD